jgi:hypothetical protein
MKLLKLAAQRCRSRIDFILSRLFNPIAKVEAARTQDISSTTGKASVPRDSSKARLF